MTLTNEQRRHVKKQLLAHYRPSKLRNIVLDKDTAFELHIENGVFGSDIMNSAMYLARFLHHNYELYYRKDALDMGCGPGTQGIVMLAHKARSVVFSDISPKAVANTKKNIEDYANAEVYESDLFTQLPKRTYDVIVFNHPFFASSPERFEGDPNDDEILRRSMLGGTELLQRFLRQGPNYLRQDGIIINAIFSFCWGRK